jgi:hypothetical protein
VPPPPTSTIVPLSVRFWTVVVQPPASGRMREVDDDEVDVRQRRGERVTRGADRT